MTKTILDVVQECDNFVPEAEPTVYLKALQNYYKFRVNGFNQKLGYIHEETIGKIEWSCSWSIDHQQREVVLNTSLTATADERSQVVDETLKATKSKGSISMLESWRDERFPVYGPEGEVLFEIERCASALFGIVTYGVQLLCFTNDAHGLRLWVGKRSERKQTYPGMLDCTAAGGLGTGKLPIDGLLSEAQEEACLPAQMVREKARSMGHITYFHVRGSKAGGEVDLLQPEIEYTYELELETDMAPKPGDSEVEAFSLYTIDEVVSALMRGLFKPNSAVVVVNFLIRHTVITSENEVHYENILSHLHRELDLPTMIYPYI
ncbi:hypothetical protein N7462_007391 [Penicillium macrosclerotiorum]|uniref:uncharacterized protein n=1 Tax=Penicillium macrosclerotiorum TaxID=303699 RepID=UPI002546E28A|nr:uncharacterized protein N7462_007391 [Penicillium macrosclerotiorum]KAJ5679147.1 hypothetical protein N7462_007391 [Penicillium macrosclerotiorum]